MNCSSAWNSEAEDNRMLIFFWWLQAYYLASTFPIEKAPTKKLSTLESGVKIFELLDYPVRGLVFEGGNTLRDLANAVSDSCICLQNNNIPYNVLIADSGKRIFLLPQVLICELLSDIIE